MSVKSVEASRDSVGEVEASTMTDNISKDVIRGLKDGLPVLLGVIPFALVLGAQACHKGLSHLEVPLMTGLNFAGGSEFAAIQIWTSPPHILLMEGAINLVGVSEVLGRAVLTLCKPYTITLYW